MTAQANYMRVLVRWQDVTPAQRLRRREHLTAALASASVSSAPGAAEDAAALTAALAYEGPLELLCVVRALLKKTEQRVLVGDWVTVSSVEWTAARGMVTALLPRVGLPLTEPPVANVQQLLLCFALTDPPVEAVQLTRFLVSTEATGLPFLLLFNKSDLGSPQRRADVAAHLASWGYAGQAAPRFVSVATGEGVAQLAASLAGTVTAIIGPSGVGKSSLINALRCVEGASDTETDMLGAGGGNRGRVRATGGSIADWGAEAEAALGSAGPAWEVQTVKAVSGRSRRGRHTTRHVTLLRLPGGGLLADTPGFGLPSLEEVSARDMAACFPEARAALAAAPAGCAFANCTHRDEPGCVARGEPKWERYGLYRELYEESAARESAAARMGARRLEPGSRTKAARGSGGAPRVEALLAPQRHRRVNRTNANAALADEVGRLTAEDEEEEEEE